jgi:hypothetical protein
MPARRPPSFPLRSGLHAAASILLAGGWLLDGSPAAAQQATWVPEIFREADLPLGERLIRENKCSECHIRNVGGDGLSLYNPKGRISTPGALRGMVDYCSTQLNLGFFPEEVTAIAAVLQRDHYRFSKP